MSALAGVLLKVSPSSLGWSEPSNDALIQKVAVFAFPVFLIAVPAVDAFRRWLERRSLRPLIKDIMEAFKQQIFTDPNQPSHAHRLTLFRHCRLVLRRRRLGAVWGGGWLKVFERTGHTTQNSKTVFFAPNDPDKAEGIVGVAWAGNSIALVEDLPKIDARSNPEQLRDYASKSKDSAGRVGVSKPKYCAIYAIPIEVGGRVWGVLAIDTWKTKLPMDKIDQHQQVAVRFLSRVLERL